MASSGSGYDLSSSTFSPDGRIFQIEYAAKAVENAGTALGLRCADGVVLAVEKPLVNRMLVARTTGGYTRSTSTRASRSRVSSATAGRSLTGRGRRRAITRRHHGTKIPPATLSSRISAYVHYFTLHGALRPFGASTLVAAYDTGTKRHSLHMIEPSGVCYEYYGAAAGRGRQPARTEMEKLVVNPSRVPEGGEMISVSEGVRQLAKIIHSLHDDAKDKPFELEMSWLCEGSGWKHEGVPREIIAGAVEWAKKEIENEGENDEEGDDDEDDEMEE
ncbi:LOW QUALITY PROTEIN: hypothetical protein ACHAW5_003101 [Stephanodiscus triporus]|uniref:Proteasome subunit alpha type n=1 Tax=Stephanodiscus triporus TaxID=2934178 RepID=A0ABD3MC85_9STRA